MPPVETRGRQAVDEDGEPARVLESVLVTVERYFVSSAGCSLAVSDGGASPKMSGLRTNRSLSAWTSGIGSASDHWYTACGVMPRSRASALALEPYASNAFCLEIWMLTARV